MARKKDGPKVEELTGDEWIATYSDTITLLLTFFILLYSFSSVDQEKLKQISTALQSVLNGSGGVGILEFNMNNGDVPIVGESIQKDNLPQAEADMYSKVKEFVDENNLSSTVDIQQDERGVIIQLRDNILFESAKADIREESKSILDKINNLMDTFPNHIVVEGHTDNLAINTFKYESNWELSTARAVNVVRYFVETKGQKPARFAAAGYGEYKPMVPNDTNDNRSKNRRVNILILATDKEKR
ncbi:OmpA family protein [Clostridium algidicarnis]|uniref:OmpA family protein n=1 Tax=Clostridium algidicarnis TaxID=37659 RepID=UPI001C0DDED4|nr:OmpA family protein [Clostridium algidicarnis]MBU3195821.1 OmpA family protein [Clostridium algidicarnis]